MRTPIWLSLIATFLFVNSIGLSSSAVQNKKIKQNEQEGQVMNLMTGQICSSNECEQFDPLKYVEEKKEEYQNKIKEEENKENSSKGKLADLYSHYGFECCKGEEAIGMTKKALELSQDINSLQRIIWNAGVLEDIYEKEDNLEEMKKYHQIKLEAKIKKTENTIKQKSNWPNFKKFKIAKFYSNLGELLEEVNKYDESINNYKEAISIYERCIETGDTMEVTSKYVYADKIKPNDIPIGKNMIIEKRERGIIKYIREKIKDLSIKIAFFETFLENKK